MTVKMFEHCSSGGAIVLRTRRLVLTSLCYFSVGMLLAQVWGRDANPWDAFSPSIGGGGEPGALIVPVFSPCSG